MQETPLVSIIIPLPRFNDYIREAIPYYERLNYPEFEIIILPDTEQKEVLSDKLPIRVIPSGAVGPAEKRDLGAKQAKGSILAFTDDDAFPDPNWLMNAIPYFQDKTVAAIGGPAVTPPNEGFWQKISGNVYASVFMSGSYRKRYVRTGVCHEDFDLPSVNLITRRDVFESIGGFDSTFYPGEDTKFCLEIKKLGHKIIYNPDVLVYHHRRPLFPNHFKQIANYALHRGFFVKVYPETSRKPAYFAPSVFLVAFTGGLLLSFFSNWFALAYISGISLYFLLNILAVLNKNPLETILTAAGVFLSHLTYGAWFLKGLLFTKELKR